MFEIKENACYTIKDLTDGLFVSRSSVYEMMKNGLKYSTFGGKRIVTGVNLKTYIDENERTEAG